MEKEPIVIEFDRCPGTKPDGTPCGSTRFLADTLSKEVKKRGLMKPEVENYVHVINGVVVDQNRIKELPVGISLPAYTLHTDVCMECGLYSVRKIVIGEAQLGAAQMPVRPPGLGPSAM